MEGWVNLGTAVSVQPMPKAAHRSNFRENTNFCPQRDSNLGPLVQEASVLPTSEGVVNRAHQQLMTTAIVLQECFKMKQLRL